ncbi:MAG: CHAT domain-containing protein [Chitinophagaceae bacterium]|nr:CHAT domain-containing protein [Chitinophagaceae bacterium]
MALCISVESNAQVTPKQIWNSIIQLEGNASFSETEKLQKADSLKRLMDEERFEHDSVYARLLHRIAVLKYLLNNEIATQECIDYTMLAVQINSSGKKNTSPYFVVNSYLNLGGYFESTGFFRKAYLYYDSAILYNRTKQLFNPLAPLCYSNKAIIGFRLGDYQKCIEDCSKGIEEARQENNAELLLALSNQRAQAYLYMQQLANASADADIAESCAKRINSSFELATAIKTKALIAGEYHRYEHAEALFRQAINERMLAQDAAQISDDYTDMGNFYIRQRRYKQAENCYLKTIQFAKKANNPEKLSKGYINLAEVCFRQKQQNNYSACLQYYKMALQVYNIQEPSILQNSTLRSLSVVGNTDLLVVILANKTELLLDMYRTTQKKEYIRACIATGMLMDSAITQARHEQTGETSKLYWRNSTRSFFENMLEACYITGNMEMAFFFMEKSRAVLLSDKLNELGAGIYLPFEAAKEERLLQLRVINEREKLSRLAVDETAFKEQEIKYLREKENFERYVRTLENNYPAYYQYKYSGIVPSLQTFRQKITGATASFVHCFVGDSVTFFLKISPGDVKMLRLTNKELDKNQMAIYVNRCSDKQWLNNHYNEFAELSYKLYRTIFEPLHITENRIIVCQDNMLLPFETLCSDKAGAGFLVKKYMFSYVYSASYLLQLFTINPASGDFIGFAPVSFEPYLGVPDLTMAGKAMKTAGMHYDNILLLENKNASRNNFIHKMGRYRIVNVFSHAIADTGSTAPLLYMQDSLIRLQELQLIREPSTQLVVLSACQTNVGRNETGEGIYSLARGFAFSGIPSVSATLWKADEDVVYFISNRFHEYLAKGLWKDEALQKAKLDFIKQGNKEGLLPYYWANMVLIGRSEPVDLAGAKEVNETRWLIFIVIGLLIAAVLAIIYYFRKSIVKQKQSMYENKNEVS